MRLSALRRRPAAPVPVHRGERLLAWAASGDGAAGGTRDALYLPRRVPWEQVEAADWDNETSELRVSEVGAWGDARPEHRFAIDDPGRLLELVRERVTASVVLQRHVAIDGRRGLRVIARRAPRGDQPVQWVYEYDEGVDPTDPAVEAAAAQALEAARADVGAV